MKRLACLLAMALALCDSVAARAEVWGYLDEKGVSHFASEQLDARYELFFRGPDPAAGGNVVPPAAGVPAAATKLVAFIEVSPRYKQVQHHLRVASSKYDIDYELLKALIATESGFDALAVSPKGAVGLMQVMPATAQRYGVTASASQPLQKKLADPGVNIRTGTRYLRALIDMFPGRLDLALAAYNAGEGAVQRAGNRVPDYPETRNYVKTVMQLYAMLKPPAAPDPLGRLPGRVHVQLPAPLATSARDDKTGQDEPVL